MKLSSLFHRQLTSKREKFKKIFPFLWTKLCLLWLKNLSVYKPDCTDYSQRISNKMAIFKLSSIISIRTIDSLLSSISALRNIVLVKQIEYLLFRTKMGLNILAVSEFLVKSLRILLAISRDPGNCEEHNKETISHEIKKGN